MWRLLSSQTCIEYHCNTRIISMLALKSSQADLGSPRPTMKKLMPLTGALLALSSPLCLAQAESPTEVALDVATLAHSSYWHKLGHYQSHWSGRIESQVDSDEFFFSAQGKRSPERELEATIHAFYQQEEAQAHIARCQFPARFTWLEEQQGRRATLDCPELETWKAVLDPQGLTLVFPTAFMNNPSSMFGHTLLRVDAKDQTRHKELVAFAVNFAAEPETQDNAALYAMKGLFGAYPGRYTVMPYYRKVREYNDIESRDIWEYPLNLTENEVERVLLHLWEMQQAQFDYYFLDENCSYQLLALLELAREDLYLVDQFPVQAIPSDTVKALAAQDLLAAPQYRAAFGTRLLHQSQSMSDERFAAAQRAKRGIYPSASEYSDAERAAILEFAYEWLNFELYDQGLERDPTAKQLTELLYQRSIIKTPSPFSDVPVPSVSPEHGHGSARVGLGYRYSDLNRHRLTLDWRAAYHDLLDSQAGFIPGAQISFLDAQMSLDDNGTSRLEKLYVIDAMALAPSNRLFSSWAWNIRTGFDRQPDSTNTSGRWFGQGGVGKAWGDPNLVHGYALLSTELSGGTLTDYQATLGAGAEVGLLYQINQAHKVSVQGQYLSLFDSPDSHKAQASTHWHWSMTSDFALRSEVRYRHWHRDELLAQLTAYVYY